MGIFLIAPETGFRGRSEDPTLRVCSCLRRAGAGQISIKIMIEMDLSSLFSNPAFPDFLRVSPTVAVNSAQSHETFGR
jgi:hypothetical protein